MKGPAFADLPAPLRAAVTAYDEARRDLHDSYKITGARTPAMSDANKATIAPMIQAALSAYAAALTSDPGGGAGPDETPSAAQRVGDRSREHLKTPESQGYKP